MAWQGQKDIQTSKYPHMALNVDVWNIVHSGNTLTFSATVRAVVTSGNIYYNGVSVSLTGGGSITKNMNPVSTGGYVDFGTFNCSASVPASTTSYTITASLSAGSVASGSAQWTITFGSGGTNPSGLSATYNSSTWNSVNATVSLQHWGGVAGKELEAIMVTGSSDADFNTITDSNWYLQPGKGRYVWRKQTTAYSETYNMLTSNITTTFGGPTTITGMRRYYLAAWANSSISKSAGYIDMTVRYLPPAPAQFTYTDPGGAGTKTFPVSFTGVPANNNPDYDPAYLTRSVRYRVGDDPWTVVDNDAVATLDSVTSFNVAVPAGKVATVEGWMAYHGMQSDIRTITLANNNLPAVLYGSVNGQSKEIKKLYGSFGGQTKEIKKLYASVGGVTKKIFEA